MKTQKTFLIIMFIACIFNCRAAVFDFDDGTVQGWTMEGAWRGNGASYTGPYSNNFVFGWKDPVQYPGIPGWDAVGDNEGTMQMFTFGGHGITSGTGDWWIMQLHSPDLTSDSQWQGASGYSVEIAECMAAFVPDLYANLWVKVYDTDLGTDRYFYNNEAQLLDHCVYNSEAVWNHLSFDWSGVLPANYIVREVFINIFGKIGSYYEGGIYVDHVTPFGSPVPPSNLQANITSPQIHLTWDDNSIDEDGFRIQYKRWSLIEPPGWTDLDTVGPNVQSYQVDNPTLNYYYKFRVSAYNTYGDSTYSTSNQVKILYQLYWIHVNAPNGGEILAEGANYPITWTSGIGITNVRIDYSTDGGSNWIDPPIVASTANDGSYNWTVPNTYSDNCILRISDASDGSPYDISNEPFQIVPPGPDLTVVSLTCDEQGTAIKDNELHFHCTIKNQGSLSSGWFYMYWYADEETPPDPGQIGQRNWYIPGGLIPGGTYTVDFTYTYTSPDVKKMYVLVDSTFVCTEVDEGNNLLGPQDMDVYEFEFIEDNDAAYKWFGGDDNTPRNVGGGQSFALSRSAEVKYASFKFRDEFDYHYSPTGSGHAVTLVLNVRAENGTIVKTVSENVPSSFNGGWVFFDLNMDMWADETYLFTCYLQDGHSNELSSSLCGRSDDPWPNSQGYSAETDSNPFDMEDWSHWSTHPWDFNFRLAGNYHDLAKADFTRNYKVDLVDFSEFGLQWLRTDCVLPGWCDQTDMDYDGSVDIIDLDSFVYYWLW